jgi:hypothetical protein
MFHVHLKKMCIQLGIMVHTCNPSTWEVRAGGLWVWSQPELHSKTPYQSIKEGREKGRVSEESGKERKGEEQKGEEGREEGREKEKKCICCCWMDYQSIRSACLGVVSSSATSLLVFCLLLTVTEISDRCISIYLPCSSINFWALYFEALSIMCKNI